MVAVSSCVIFTQCWWEQMQDLFRLFNQGKPTWVLMMRFRSPLVKAWPTSRACKPWIRRFSSERSKWHRFNSERRHGRCLLLQWVKTQNKRSQLSRLCHGKNVFYSCVFSKCFFLLKTTLRAVVWVVALLQPGRYFFIHCCVGRRQPSWCYGWFQQPCRVLAQKDTAVSSFQNLDSKWLPSLCSGFGCDFHLESPDLHSSEPVRQRCNGAKSGAKCSPASPRSSWRTDALVV